MQLQLLAGLFPDLEGQLIELQSLWVKHLTNLPKIFWEMKSLITDFENGALPTVKT